MSDRSDQVSLSLQGRLTRRRFLSWLGWGGIAMAGVLSVVASLRYLIPNVTYGPPVTFKIGRPEEYPQGSKRFLREARLFVIHEEGGFHAMSAVCTHIGCSLNSVDWGYICPCHGSKFDRVGKVLAGPAPKPLPWFKLFLAPDGELVVDTSRTVSPGTLFEV
ncbi:MAG: ubiquinol-cytochrome c reductase iron-sulfur subunit [Anaerolineae bacterium]